VSLLFLDEVLSKNSSTCYFAKRMSKENQKECGGRRAWVRARVVSSCFFVHNVS
jgi:hypothetical protein